VTFFRCGWLGGNSLFFSEIQVRWANVQAVNVKFSQDLTHHKSLKSVNY